MWNNKQHNCFCRTVKSVDDKKIITAICNSELSWVKIEKYYFIGSSSRPDTRVAGGIVVPENSVYYKFAVMVHAIFNATLGQLCGGSLISPNYVITAGNWVGLWDLSKSC